MPFPSTSRQRQQRSLSATGKATFDGPSESATKTRTRTSRASFGQFALGRDRSNEGVSPSSYIRRSSADPSYNNFAEHRFGTIDEQGGYADGGIASNIRERYGLGSPTANYTSARFGNPSYGAGTRTGLSSRKKPSVSGSSGHYNSSGKLNRPFKDERHYQSKEGGIDKNKLRLCVRIRPTAKHTSSSASVKEEKKCIQLSNRNPKRITVVGSKTAMEDSGHDFAVFEFDKVSMMMLKSLLSALHLLLTLLLWHDTGFRRGRQSGQGLQKHCQRIHSILFSREKCLLYGIRPNVRR